MAKTWFTSDLHLRHRAILEYTNREKELSNRVTASIDERLEAHDKWVISQINTFVGDRDYLYIIGDIYMGSNQWTAGYYISQINCVHKVLIGGNHDYKLIDFYRSSDLFEAVYDHRTEIKLNEKRIVLDHFPIAEWNNGHHGSFMLHGHTHSSFDYKAADLHDKRILDVGWDNAKVVLGEYRPFEFADILKYMDGRVSIEHHGKAD